MDKTVVLGVKLAQRINTAQDFQKVISDHGCNIKTRIGLHHVENGKCSTSGVIVLDVLGDDEEIKKLKEALKAIPEAEVQEMIFKH